VIFAAGVPDKLVIPVGDAAPVRRRTAWLRHFSFLFRHVLAWKKACLSLIEINFVRFLI